MSWASLTHNAALLTDLESFMTSLRTNSPLLEMYQILKNYLGTTFEHNAMLSIVVLPVDCKPEDIEPHSAKYQNFNAEGFSPLETVSSHPFYTRYEREPAETKSAESSEAPVILATSRPTTIKYGPALPKDEAPTEISVEKFETLVSEFRGIPFKFQPQITNQTEIDLPAVTGKTPLVHQLTPTLLSKLERAGGYSAVEAARYRSALSSPGSHLSMFTPGPKKRSATKGKGKRRGKKNPAYTFTTLASNLKATQQNLSIHPVEGCGLGVFTNAELSIGTAVAKFDGKITTNFTESFTHSYSITGITHPACFYLNGIEQSGYSHFLNHSDTPNCVIVPMSYPNSEMPIYVIYTFQLVAANSELTIDYGQLYQFDYQKITRNEFGEVVGAGAVSTKDSAAGAGAGSAPRPSEPKFATLEAWSTKPRLTRYQEDGLDPVLELD